eukprot:6464000-Amphidinium_carterae.1
MAQAAISGGFACGLKTFSVCRTHVGVRTALASFRDSHVRIAMEACVVELAKYAPLGHAWAWRCTIPHLTYDLP